MEASDQSIDPYHKWLGIPKSQQPATLYRLLGIELYESDPEVIAAAASRQVAYLHQLTSGPHRRQIQKLMNDIARARRTLIDEASREKYDQKLREEQQTRSAAEPSAKQITPAIQIQVEPQAGSLNIQRRRRVTREGKAGGGLVQRHFMTQI